MQTVQKKVEKRGSKWAVVHCHGSKAGQVIATHPTKEKALAQHRAIMASKTRKSLIKSISGLLRKADTCLVEVLGSFIEKQEKR